MLIHERCLRYGRKQEAWSNHYLETPASKAWTIRATRMQGRSSFLTNTDDVSGHCLGTTHVTPGAEMHCSSRLAIRKSLRSGTLTLTVDSRRFHMRWSALFASSLTLYNICLWLIWVIFVLYAPGLFISYQTSSVLEDILNSTLKHSELSDDSSSSICEHVSANQLHVGFRCRSLQSLQWLQVLCQSTSNRKSYFTLVCM